MSRSDQGSKADTGCPTTAHIHIALVCDWLTTPGGAEKVLLELHQMYPDAPIYTSQYRPKKIPWFEGAVVKTGWLNLFPAGLRRVLGPLRQLYFSHLDLSNYDLVISVTGAEAKSVKTSSTAQSAQASTPEHRADHAVPSPKAFHLCYCHVPTQYYWQMYDKYLKNPGFGVLNPLVRAIFKLFVRPLRQADFRASQRPDQFVTISDYAKDQIQKYYHRDAVVVHPGVDLSQFAKPPTHSTTDSYFAISCRQVNWKRVDLAIAACLAAGKRLVVIGDGPEHARLVQLAKGSDLIRFIPWLSAAELADWLRGAAGYIFPSLEPFGIAAVEALAAGCPVIAYAAGGSRDFVQPDQNGVLFAEQSVSSLERALKDFDPDSFDRKKVSASAAQFSPKHFRQGIDQLVAKALQEPKTP